MQQPLISSQTKQEASNENASVKAVQDLINMNSKETQAERARLFQLLEKEKTHK